MTRSIDRAIAVFAAAFLLLGEGAAEAAQAEKAATCTQALIADGFTSGVHTCDDLRLSAVEVAARTDKPASVEGASSRARAAADAAFLEDAWRRACLATGRLSRLDEQTAMLLIGAVQPNTLQGTVDGAFTCHNEVVRVKGNRKPRARIIRACPASGIELNSNPGAALDSFCEDTLQLEGDGARYRALLVLEVVADADVPKHARHFGGLLGRSPYSRVRSVMSGTNELHGPPDPNEWTGEAEAIVVTGDPQVDQLFAVLEAEPGNLDHWHAVSVALKEAGWSRAAQLIAVRALSMPMDDIQRARFESCLQDPWAITAATRS